VRGHVPGDRRGRGAAGQRGGTILRRVLVAVLAAASCAALSVGCSSSEAGTPRPASGSAGPAEPDSSSLDGVEPCDLLTSDDQARIGLADGEQLSEISCDWTKSSTEGVRLTLYRDRGIDDLPNLGDAVDIAGHEGNRVESPGGLDGVCGVAIEVTEGSVVVVTATTGADTEAACDLVSRAAGHVGANLP
jgi:Protein of unknown function (DUF3558)